MNPPSSSKSTDPPLSLSEPSANTRNSHPPGWVHFVAGGLGGMCGATVTAPFDLVKTRLQSSTYHSQHALANSTRPSGYCSRLLHHFVDTGRIMRDIHRAEGFQALFRGLGPTLVGVIPARAINFYVYGMGKEFYCDVLMPAGGDSSTLVHLCSAITAGIATSTATNPIWVVKTRLQLDLSPEIQSQTLNKPPLGSLKPTSNVFSSLVNPLGDSLQSIQKIYRYEGIPGFYRGLTASYLGVTEGTIQWILYEKLKRLGSRFIPEQDCREEGTWSAKMFAAGAAKLIATGITYPHEVVRTRMRQKPPPAPAKPKYTGLFSTFRTIMAEEGVSVFFPGTPWLNVNNSEPSTSFDPCILHNPPAPGFLWRHVASSLARCAQCSGDVHNLRSSALDQPVFVYLSPPPPPFPHPKSNVLSSKSSRNMIEKEEKEKLSQKIDKIPHKPQHQRSKAAKCPSLT